MVQNVTILTDTGTTQLATNHMIHFTMTIRILLLHQYCLSLLQWVHFYTTFYLQNDVNTNVHTDSGQ